jgi:hypothetical protein
VHTNVFAQAALTAAECIATAASSMQQKHRTGSARNPHSLKTNQRQAAAKVGAVEVDIH